MKKTMLISIVFAIIALTVVGVYAATDSKAQYFMQNMMGQNSDYKGMQNMMNMMHGNAMDHAKMHQAMEKAIENSGNEQLKQMHEACDKMMGFQEE